VFLAEGVRCCRELVERRSDWVLAAVAAEDALDRPGVSRIIDCVRASGRPAYLVPARRFAEFARTLTPQGILVLGRRPPEHPPGESRPDDLVLVLDRISEPGNLGTILRTAAAVGLREVWLVRSGADPFEAKAMRAGMGAQCVLDLPVVDTAADAVRRLEQCGVPTVWAADPRGRTVCYEPAFLDGPAGLIIGSEAHGTEAAALPQVRTVRIPMPGDAESLNVAQAATILLYESVRRRLAP